MNLTICAHCGLPIEPIHFMDEDTWVHTADKDGNRFFGCVPAGGTPTGPILTNETDYFAFPKETP